jgi:transposase
LVDLEQQCPVDLLPDRSAETLTTWLQEHPGSEIITRDRSDQYAKGATAGAPHAIQIADRWHLIRNWADVVERVLKRHHIALRQVQLVIPLAEQATAATLLPPKSVNRQRHYAEERRELARQIRLERWTTIRDRHAKGVAFTDIARELRLDYKTIRKYAYATECPHLKAYPPRQRLVAPYEPYLRARWAEGCRNGKQLYREIVAHGFPGSRTLVARVVAHFRRDEGLSMPWLPKLARQKPLLPRDGVTLILQRPDVRTADEYTALEQLRQVHVELDHLVALSERYTAMFRNRQAAAFDPWTQDAQASPTKEIRQFVRNLRNDEAAIRAALEHSWSNGQVEGVRRVTRMCISPAGR